MRRAVAVAVLMLLLSSCGGGGDDGRASASQSLTAVRFDQTLRRELLAMEGRDQRQRSGEPVAESDEQRTARLREIIDEHGWPTIDLVGEDGEDAAWAIAQHSDLDPAFQSEALELLRNAVKRGVASPGNLAYLEDRVAVAQGDPQTYGTQVACGRGGPKPTTPIVDPKALHERRRQAGLDPFAAYLQQMQRVCDSETS